MFISGERLSGQGIAAVFPAGNAALRNTQLICQIFLDHIGLLAFAASEKRREESVSAVEQEWLQDQVCEEDPEVRAEAMQAYMEDEWEKTGRIGTLENLPFLRFSSAGPSPLSYPLS